jgi:hypothetical protein
MTTRELRALLFDIANQATTVADLRAAFFQVVDQDAELTTQTLRTALAGLVAARGR